LILGGRVRPPRRRGRPGSARGPLRVIRVLSWRIRRAYLACRHKRPGCGTRPGLTGPAANGRPGCSRVLTWRALSPRCWSSGGEWLIRPADPCCRGRRKLAGSLSLPLSGLATIGFVGLRELPPGDSTFRRPAAQSVGLWSYGGGSTPGSSLAATLRASFRATCCCTALFFWREILADVPAVEDSGGPQVKREPKVKARTKSPRHRLRARGGRMLRKGRPAAAAMRHGNDPEGRRPQAIGGTSRRRRSSVQPHGEADRRRPPAVAQHRKGRASVAPRRDRLGGCRPRPRSATRNRARRPPHRPAAARPRPSRRRAAKPRTGRAQDRGASMAGAEDRAAGRPKRIAASLPMTLAGRTEQGKCRHGDGGGQGFARNAGARGHEKRGKATPQAAQRGSFSRCSTQVGPVHRGHGEGCGSTGRTRKQAPVCAPAGRGRRAWWQGTASATRQPRRTAAVPAGRIHRKAAAIER